MAPQLIFSLIGNVLGVRGVKMSVFWGQKTHRRTLRQMVQLVHFLSVGNKDWQDFFIKHHLKKCDQFDKFLDVNFWMFGLLFT